MGIPIFFDDRWQKVDPTDALIAMSFSYENLEPIKKIVLDDDEGHNSSLSTLCFRVYPFHLNFS